MTKEFIGKGSTLEAATAAAKAGLAAPETADIKIEVIATPKKKFLGLFGTTGEFEVKVSYEDGRREKKPKNKKSPKQNQNQKAQDKKPNPNQNKNQKQSQNQNQSAPKAQKKPAPQPKYEPKNDTERKPVSQVTADEIDLDKAVDYLKAILDGLKIKDPKVNAQFVDGTVEMEIECEDYGIIIGHRGETLDAIQYLTGLAIKNDIDKYVRVSLNVGDYRKKREETLTNLAIKNANFVLRSGRRYIFEPMNPYERRIIHTAVHEVDGVISRSVGSGMDRKVLIEPEGGVKRPYRSNYQRGRGGSYSGSKRTAQSKPDPDREKVVDRADIPKFGKIEVNND